MGRGHCFVSRFTFHAGLLLIALLLGPLLSSTPLCSLALAARSPLPAPRALGCLFTPPGRWSVQQPHLVAKTASLSAVDLSPDLPPVGDQGAQASCVGWATAYYAKTYQEKRERGWAVRTPGGQPVYEHIASPAYVFNQVYVEYVGGVGAYIGDALALLVSQGAAPWSLFPYIDQSYQNQPTYAQRRAALPYQTLQYGAFFLSDIGDPRAPTLANNDLQPLKDWLAAGQPVILAIPVYAEFDAPAGPYAIVDVPANTYSYRGGHAVLLVGYDDHIGGTGVGGFKFVNSWGLAYGCAGYGYLTYDLVRHYVPEAWWITDRTAQGPYLLCGHVRNVAQNPLPGTSLTIGGVLPVSSSSDGFYGWGGLAAGDVVVRPARPDYTFQPQVQWVHVEGDREGVDFVGTSVNPGPLDCETVIPAGVGGVFMGDTTGAPFNVHRYNCVDWNESGPERVYRITATRTGTIRATLSDLTADLDVFILADCDETTCLAAGNWQATLSNAPPGAYYVVVDGYAGACGRYTLNLEVPWDCPYRTYLPVALKGHLVKNGAPVAQQ